MRSGAMSIAPSIRSRGTGWSSALIFGGVEGRDNPSLSHLLPLRPPCLFSFSLPFSFRFPLPLKAPPGSSGVRGCMGLTTVQRYCAGCDLCCLWYMSWWNSRAPVSSIGFGALSSFLPDLVPLRSSTLVKPVNVKRLREQTKTVGT